MFAEVRRRIVDRSVFVGAVGAAVAFAVAGGGAVETSGAAVVIGGGSVRRTMPDAGAPHYLTNYQP